MPRIRSIKPEHRAHRKVGPLSDRSYRLWVSMMCEADDGGRFIANVAQLKAQTWPYHGVTTEEVEAAIQAIAKLGSIKLYHVGKTRYGVFLSWAKHQHPKYPSPSRYPPPPFPHHSPTGSGMVRKRSPRSREGLSKEGLSRELQILDTKKLDFGLLDRPTSATSGPDPAPTSGNGRPNLEYQLSPDESGKWRLEYRAALIAQGWTFTKADTEAGRLTANEVEFFRAHGHRRP
jgi:hypothetical protein